MKTTRKLKVKKTVFILCIGFFALFAYRLATAGKETPTPGPFIHQPEVSESNLDIRKNYATIKHKVQSGQAPMRIDQKYEKIADIKSSTNRFDLNEQRIRKQILDFNGLIQFENKNGNTGFRNLNLVIGVPPKHFDSMYQRLIEIGTVQAKQITKKDKTNEYKELRAKKLSLEKIRSSLIALKGEGGRIEEYMQLENRILEIEQQLQDLGVSLGNFDEENEFCTVKLSLSEVQVHQMDLFERITSAIMWTLATYLKLMLTLTLMAGFAYLTVAAIEKFRQGKTTK
ncbi:DUF4349 domain-containing protein [Maribacter sp. ANRC-HE7]|uniref:DUF4349 domain-containing protein n=1 Tax=Maribacter aquimaris TaxID=2737171 RepID=A0ABR7V0A7_9FLAO|nr:DUF4349 domain-containing protein [Maribacter aquimaris]MBD0778269.1 DUF4349 domain-containing protein [Maribacter aquimaris]